VATGAYEVGQSRPGRWDIPPYRLAGGYGTVHTPRDQEWPRKAKELDEIRNLTGQPEVGDEPMGAAEHANGERSNVAADFGDYAALAALLGNGATFHHDEHYTRLEGLTPRIEAAAREFFAALKWVPPYATRGYYTAGHLHDIPIRHNDAWALRTFARIVGGDAWVVVVRPTRLGPDGQYVVEPQNGWRVVGRDGPNGRRIHLQR
jgi:hypothetical protein